VDCFANERDVADVALIVPMKRELLAGGPLRIQLGGLTAEDQRVPSPRYVDLGCRRMRMDEARICGRDAERAQLAALVTRIRNGDAAAVVLRGAPGIGKTTLLDDLAKNSEAVTVLRVTGVETEAELPYAALHLLLRPVADQIAALPEAQRSALRGALGLSAESVNRFQVGLGVLTLLAQLSADRPLLCLVDDAQWLDRESAAAILFAVRRLAAERVGVVFAARDGNGFGEAADLDELQVLGLAPQAAEELLARHSTGLALSVRDQLLREAEGNPLALLELPRALTPQQLAGGFGVLTPVFVEPGTLPSRVLRGFRDRIEVLPRRTRKCLLIVALAADSDPDAILAAARACGADVDDVAELERAGLVRVDHARIAPWHPLVRLAAQVAADIKERIEAHLALAAVLGGDRGARHRAAAAIGPDEALATELDGVADRAEARGALSVASSTAERAAALTADPTQRYRRLAYAAATALEAGQSERAEQLARRAGPGAAVVAARQLAGVRALLEFERGVPLAAARILLEDAAPAASAMPSYLASVIARAAIYTWSGAAGPEQDQLFARLREHASGPLSALVEGLRCAAAGEPAVAVPAIRGYAIAAGDRATPFPQRLAAGHAALLIGDHRLAHDLATDLVAECYRDGRMMLLPQPLGLLAITHLQLGAPEDAVAACQEALRMARDTGQHHRLGHLQAVSAWLAAVGGDEEGARLAADRAIGAPADQQRAAVVGWAVQTHTMLDLQLGRYESLLARLEHASAGPARHSISIALHTLPDGVEAGARLGRTEQATHAAERFTAWAQASGQAWARAVAARCAALLAADAQPHYREALALHENASHPLEHARTLLLFGEWLRRRQLRAQAAAQLTAARDLFGRLGARGWAARAEDELRAAGYAAPAAAEHDDPLAGLTPQERQVVRLAAEGASNRDIAARLFLSPRTVAYHLYKAYPKLGVASRADIPNPPSSAT